MMDLSATPPPAVRRARPLSVAQRFVRAPLGFLWLVVLAILSAPVLVIMTILYYVRAGVRALAPRRRRDRRQGPARGEAEERAA